MLLQTLSIMSSWAWYLLPVAVVARPVLTLWTNVTKIIRKLESIYQN